MVGGVCFSQRVLPTKDSMRPSLLRMSGRVIYLMRRFWRRESIRFVGGVGEVYELC